MDRYVLAQLTQLYMTVKLECPFYEVTQRKGDHVRAVKPEYTPSYPASATAFQLSAPVRAALTLLSLPQGPRLPHKYQVKSFLLPGRSLETPVDPHLYNSVKNGLVNLLGARSYFGSKVLTPNCYTLGNTRNFLADGRLNTEGSTIPFLFP